MDAGRAREYIQYRVFAVITDKILKGVTVSSLAENIFALGENGITIKGLLE